MQISKEEFIKPNKESEAASSLSDEDIIGAVSTGTELSKTRFVNRFYNKIVRSCEYRLNCHGLAQDAAMLAFADTLKTMEANKIGDRPVVGYLMIAAARHSAAIKREQREESVRITTNDVLEGESEGNNPELLEEKRQNKLNVFNFVSLLPDDCEEVINMIFKQGKKPKDVAKELDISYSQLTYRRNKGIRLLGESIGDKEGLLADLLYEQAEDAATDDTIIPCNLALGFNDSLSGFWKEDVGWTTFEDKMEVSTQGQIRSYKQKVVRILSDSLDWRSSTVTLFKDGSPYPKLIGEIVADAFLSKPPEPCTLRWLDGNKRNNNVTNLKWLLDEAA